MARKATKEEFIKKARLRHGDKYDYSLVEYVNSHTKIKLVCSKHGEFCQCPNDHLKGHGCFLCGKDALSKYSMNTSDFINKAMLVHGDLYDYSKAEYLSYSRKVSIICKKHGLFYQSPNQHLSGRGCKKCSMSKGEKKIDNWLKTNGYKYTAQHIVQNFRFDFVVSVGDSTVVIEFNGSQHYTPKGFGSKKENSHFLNLMDNIKRDTQKYNKCKENNITLLVIPYWDIDRIDEILHQFFNGCELTFGQTPNEVIKYSPHRKKIRERLNIPDFDFLCGLF